jgi:hypothetical protein
MGDLARPLDLVLRLAPRGEPRERVARGALVVRMAVRELRHAGPATGEKVVLFGRETELHGASVHEPG